MVEFAITPPPKNSLDGSMTLPNAPPFGSSQHLKQPRERQTGRPHGLNLEYLSTTLSEDLGLPHHRKGGSKGIQNTVRTSSYGLCSVQRHGRHVNGGPSPVSYSKAPSLLPNSEEEFWALASRLPSVSVQRLSGSAGLPRTWKSKALKLQQSRASASASASASAGAGSDAQAERLSNGRLT